MAFDLIVRGGTIADGRGGTPFEADVAISNGRIAEVGRIAANGAEEIDAGGMLVTPGFVDIHSHYDGQAMWEEQLLSSGWHGVTTTVMGNCGVGFAPVRAADRDLLVELMEGVEDIPRDVLNQGLNWDWSTFPEYLDAVERRGHDCDICAQLPHSSLRVYVMGERAVRRERATPDDIAEMRRLAKEAMEAGALGFSTSLHDNHRTPKGDPIPSKGADADELVGISLGLKDAGKGVLQMILNLMPDEREAEFDMMRRMMRESGCSLSLTVLQRHRDPEGWREIMAMIEESVAQGFEIYAQTTPRPLGTLFGIDMERNPFCYHPSYKAIAHDKLEKKLAIMRDPAFRAKLLAEQPEQDDAMLARRICQFDYMFPFGDPPDYAPPREQCITAIAEREGRSPYEVAYDYMLEDDGRAMLFAPDNNYLGYSNDASRELIEHPRGIVAVGDGGAHAAHISDISFPTYVLSYWGRDRPAGALDLGFLVGQLTAQTAVVVGLGDRGIIAPGYKGDLNVIDMDRLSLARPYMAHDLPLGAKRLLQRADGYKATIVSGVPIYRDGEATGALPGGLVRGPQPAP